MNYEPNYIEIFKQIEALKLQFCNPYTVYPERDFREGDTSHSNKIFLNEHFNLSNLIAHSGWLNKDISQIAKKKSAHATSDKNPLGWAFSEKYESIDDARSLVQDWDAELRRAISHLNQKTLSGSILHIGSDIHFEPQILLAKSKSTTLADISKKLLEKAGSFVKPKHQYQTSAEQLEGIPDESIDLYIALRVYCSANFNHQKAIAKAVEKLKIGGSILLSVSNGYMAVDNTILPGQITDTPAKLSLSAPFDQVFQIIKLLHAKGFRELFLVPGSSELFFGGTYLPAYSALKTAPIIHLETLNAIPLCFYSEKMPTAWLGNFSEHEIIINGELWPTVEHYFQSNKFDNPIHKERIRRIAKPSDAKKYAWQFQSEEKYDWAELRMDIMRRGLAAKFSQHKQINLALKNTFKRSLTETSSTDDFWGRTTDGIGENNLGNLLMEIRKS